MHAIDKKDIYINPRAGAYNCNEMIVTLTENLCMHTEMVNNHIKTRGPVHATIKINPHIKSEKLCGN